MVITRKPLTDLIPYPDNARTHPERQVEQLATLIKRFGFHDSHAIAVDEGGVILWGHGRLLAAKKAGFKDVPVEVVTGLSDEDKRALRIADNGIGDQSDWDMEALARELDALNQAGYQMGLLSLDEALMEELGDIFDPGEMGGDDDWQGGGELQCDPDEVPEDDDVVSRCQRGDVWRLGRHRLMCGDSTDRDDVEKLMEGERAELVFTSPPYSDMRQYAEGTDLSIEELARIFATWPANFFAVNLGLKFKDHAIVTYWDEWIASAQSHGLKILGWNVWDKTMSGSIASQTNMFTLTHEWIFVFGKEARKLFRIVPNQLEKYAERHGENWRDGKQCRARQFDGSISVSTSTTYEHHQMHSVTQQTPELGLIRKHHPATFPVGLPEQYILSFCDESQLIAEPFGGSGSTLIAAEKTGRDCRMMELDPHYCDVIIQRWETLTGETAVKE